MIMIMINLIAMIMLHKPYSSKLLIRHGVSQAKPVDCLSILICYPCKKLLLLLRVFFYII